MILSQSRTGLLCAVLASLFFGGSVVVNKLGLNQTRLSPFHFTCLSVMFAGLLGLIHLTFKKQSLLPCRGKPLFYILFIGIFASGIAFILLFQGQQLTTATNTGFLITLTTFFTILFAILILNETFHVRNIPLIFTLFGGVYLLIVGARGLHFYLGDFLIILTSAIWGFTNALSKRVMSWISADQLTSLRLIIGGLFLGILLIPALPEIARILPSDPPWYLLSGFFLWAYIVFLYLGIQKLGAISTTLIMLSSPLISTAGSVLFLQEMITWHMGVGGLLMLVSLCFLIKRK